MSMQEKLGAFLPDADVEPTQHFDEAAVANLVPTDEVVILDDAGEEEYPHV